jgi:hypothetical protein
VPDALSELSRAAAATPPAFVRVVETSATCCSVPCAMSSIARAISATARRVSSEPDAMRRAVSTSAELAESISLTSSDSELTIELNAFPIRPSSSSDSSTFCVRSPAATASAAESSPRARPRMLRETSVATPTARATAISASAARIHRARDATVEAAFIWAVSASRATWANVSASSEMLP